MVDITLEKMHDAAIQDDGLDRLNPICSTYQKRFGTASASLLPALVQPLIQNYRKINLTLMGIKLTWTGFKVPTPVDPATIGMAAGLDSPEQTGCTAPGLKRRIKSSSDGDEAHRRCMCMTQGARAPIRKGATLHDSTQL